MLKQINSKKISLLSGIALGVTSMLGSGWLFSSQLAAKYAGNWSFLSWVIAGVFAMMVGTCLSIVAREYPVTGITTRSSSISHNNIFGMPFAFANWFGIVAVIANEAQATGQYIFGLIKSPIFLVNGQITFWGDIAELLIVIIYLIINYYGIKALARVNNIVTVLKIFIPTLGVVLLMTAHFDTSNFYLDGGGGYGAKSAIAALVSAGLVYSLNGFQTVASFAGDVVNPRRNIPLAMFIAIIIVTIFYMLLQLAFMGAVPHAKLANGWGHLNFASPLFSLAIALGLNFFSMLLIASSIISPSGTGYTYLGSASRMLFAMAKEGQVPMWFAKMSPKHGFSLRSLYFNFVLVSILLFVGKSWSVLMVIVTGCNIVGYMASPLSMGALKSQTRIFGAIVFALVTALLSTVPVNDMLIINYSMTIVMLIYVILQLQKYSFIKIINYTLPFLVFLWAFCWIQNQIIMVALGILFYTLSTNKKYVIYCTKERDSDSEHLRYNFQK